MESRPPDCPLTLPSPPLGERTKVRGDKRRGLVPLHMQRSIIVAGRGTATQRSAQRRLKRQWRSTAQIMAGADTKRGHLGPLVAAALWWFTELLGWAGALLVVYTVITWATKEPWLVVERHAPLISPLLTLIGTTLTAASVYFHSPTPRAPWHHSKYVAAPIVIASSVAAIGILALSGQLSQVSVSGFGMLAIADGLKRLLTYPVEPTEAQGIKTG